MISHEWGKDREVFTTSGTYPWSFVVWSRLSCIYGILYFKLNGIDNLTQIYEIVKWKNIIDTWNWILQASFLNFIFRISTYDLFNIYFISLYVVYFTVDKQSQCRGQKRRLICINKNLDFIQSSFAFYFSKTRTD